MVCTCMRFFANISMKLTLPIFEPRFKGGYKLEVNFGEKCQK
jgi:hypothetical protein